MAMVINLITVDDAYYCDEIENPPGGGNRH